MEMLLYREPLEELGLPRRRPQRKLDPRRPLRPPEMGLGGLRVAQ